MGSDNKKPNHGTIIRSKDEGHLLRFSSFKMLYKARANVSCRGRCEVTHIVMFAGVIANPSMNLMTGEVCNSYVIVVKDKY